MAIDHLINGIQKIKPSKIIQVFLVPIVSERFPTTDRYSAHDMENIWLRLCDLFSFRFFFHGSTIPQGRFGESSVAINVATLGHAVDLRISKNVL